ncbi:MAG: M10 family metallopeptidase C-terminal domain-containing protein [Alphaproteobacteria bacterium]|nr:M10 family metallopeptidase C-terminal domain-containing protein [Alphaproteobacteria bacterium]
MLDGANGWDRLYGRQGDDTLIGGNGGDMLYGNAGADIMSGGTTAQRDRFIYFRDTDTGVGEGNRDVITDFQSGTDRIEISRIDANIVLGGPRQDFIFIADTAFSNTAGELRYEQTGTETILQADRNGDGVSDWEIELTGTVTLQSGDFVF